jgi:transcriptional regulator NrdR family protein
VENPPTECPQCGNDTQVIDSRQDDEKRRRRHVCRRCNTRFTTYEITADEYDRLQSVKINMSAIREAIKALQVVEKVATNGTAKN